MRGGTQKQIAVSSLVFLTPLPPRLSPQVYYWHTVSREVTWDRPAGSEAFVPSVMPKTDKTAATAEA